MSTLLESHAVDRASIERVLEVIDELAGLPPFGAIWLRMITQMGMSGQLTVDVSNVVCLTLEPGSFDRLGDRTNVLSWWAALVRGSLTVRDDRSLVLALEGFAPSTESLIDCGGATLTEGLSALSELGYALTLGVALALESANSRTDCTISYTRTRGRGATLDALSLRIAKTPELSPLVYLSDLAERAGKAVAAAACWEDDLAWHYLELFGERAPSDNARALGES
ncbi:MAG: hypothetical protein Q8Q09_21075 [Deltaproteobacteria bacterium]|nr:hypothetical protein [Deltaproteobacteria bacterium]